MRRFSIGRLTAIAPTDQNPGRLTRRNSISAWHSQLNVLCEVLEVIDRLLNCVVFQARDGQVVVRVRGPIKPMFKNDRRAILLLSNFAVYTRVPEVPNVVCSRDNVRGRSTMHQGEWPTVPSAFSSPGVNNMIGPPENRPMSAVFGCKSSLINNLPDS